MTNERRMTKPESKHRHSVVIRSLDIVSSFAIGASSFRSRRERSHVLDNVIAELRAFDFSRAFHETREIVRDTFAGDRAA